MLKMAWYSILTGFLMCWFQWHNTFRCFWVMGYMYALSWKLFIMGLLSEHFATLVVRLHLKKISTKCLIFLHQLYFFLIGRSWTFWGDKDQMSPGRAKGRGKWGYGERIKIRCVFLQNSHYWDTNTTIVISTPKNLHAETFKWFWTVLPGEKQLCVFLRNKYGYLIGNAMEKIGNVKKQALSLPLSPKYMFEADQMSSFQDMTYYFS